MAPTTGASTAILETATGAARGSPERRMASSAASRAGSSACNERGRADHAGQRIDGLAVLVEDVVHAVAGDRALDLATVAEVDGDARRRPLALPVEDERSPQELADLRVRVERGAEEAAVRARELLVQVAEQAQREDGLVLGPGGALRGLEVGVPVEARCVGARLARSRRARAWSARRRARRRRASRPLRATRRRPRRGQRGPRLEARRSPWRRRRDPPRRRRRAMLGSEARSSAVAVPYGKPSTSGVVVAG